LIDNLKLLEDIVYLGTFPIILLTVHEFYSHILGEKFKSERQELLTYCIFFILISVIHMLKLPSDINYFVNLSLFFALTFLYKNQIMWKIFASMFISIATNLGDFLSQSLVYLVITAYSSEEEAKSYIISLFLSKFVITTVIYIAMRFFTSYGKGTFSKKHWFYLIVSQILSLFILNQYIEKFVLNSNYELSIYLALAVIVINFFIFMIGDNILYKQLINKKTELLVKQVDYYANQYHLAENSQKHNIKFRHDLKNMLIGLDTELKAGKYEKSEAIIQGLLDNFSVDRDIIHSGNIVIDSIVNYKKQAADENNIKMEIDLRVPPDIILDATDYSVIMGNILDNAVDACVNLENSADAFIKIQLHYENKSLFLSISNSYNGIFKKNSRGAFLSTKNDSSIHGIGLKSVEGIVLKSNGVLKITPKEKEFLTEVILFNIERENDATSKKEVS